MISMTYIEICLRHAQLIRMGTGGWEEEEANVNVNNLAFWRNHKSKIDIESLKCPTYMLSKYF